MLLVKYFCVTCYIFLTSIIVYGLFSLIIFWFAYICGIFSLLLINHDFFFFFCWSCIYLCYFFLLHRFFFFLLETYSHILMVINCKLVINNDILKSILTQNRPNRTLCTTPYHTCDHKIEVQCCVVMILAKSHRKHPYICVYLITVIPYCTHAYAWVIS